MCLLQKSVSQSVSQSARHVEDWENELTWSMPASAGLEDPESHVANAVGGREAGRWR